MSVVTHPTRLKHYLLYVLDYLFGNPYSHCDTSSQICEVN